MPESHAAFDAADDRAGGPRVFLVNEAAAAVASPSELGVPMEVL